MRVYPVGAQEKLGFSVIGDRLESFVLGDAGIEAIRSLRPSSDIDNVRRALDRVSELQSMFESGERVALNSIPDIRTILENTRPEGAIIAAEGLLAVAEQTACAQTWRDFFARHKAEYPRVVSITSRLHPLPELVKFIGSTIDPDGTIRDGASPELRRLRSQMRKKAEAVRKVVQAALKDAESAGHAAAEQPTIREGRLVVPIVADAKRAVSGVIHSTSATGQTVFIEPIASMELNNDLRLLEIQEQREIRRILGLAAERVRDASPQLEQNHTTLTRLDVLQAKARLARELNATKPLVNTEGRIHVEGARNPVLLLRAGARVEQEVVPIDLKLGIDYDTIVISGPNAGGKTVTMKTVGLLSLMVAYGIPVPAAEGSEMALFKAVMVDIGDEQSIERDLSTFGSHVLNLAEIVRRSGPGVLVLIDEAGTATDPSHGAAIARAVIEHVTESGARAVVTTHHGALKAFAQGQDRVVNAALHFDNERLEPTFVFRPGTPGSSYAFEVASRKGLPQGILERARGLLASGETRLDELVTQLEEQRAEVMRRGAALDNEKRLVDQMREDLDTSKTELHTKRDDILRQAEIDAAHIMKEANRVIEQTIREIKESQAERESTKKARKVFEDQRKRVQRRVEKRKRRKKPSPHGTPSEGRETSSRMIRPGDRVVLDQGNTPGEVLAIAGDTATVAFGSMTTRVKRKRLTRIGEATPQSVTVKRVGGPDLATASSIIDVRGQRVDGALRIVSRALDRALLAGLRNLDIVHGSGTGALKKAIRDYLDAADEVESHYEPDADAGGPGMTIARLK